MKDGPDIAYVSALIGDPARANMLTALMSGKALTASELASEGGVTLPTASAHLSRLEQGGLVRQRRQGRHRYFSLADEDVGRLLETLMGLAAKKGHLRVRTGPRDPALRHARVCYDHLAGDLAVRVLDSALARRLITEQADGAMTLTRTGHRFFTGFGIDVDHAGRPNRPMCRACLDWSARRSHLAGALGTAFLNRLYDTGWARRETGSRIVRFTASGERKLIALFPVPAAAGS
jgi:DNA-binding transcriptional ArsR family regulator